MVSGTCYIPVPNMEELERCLATLDGTAPSEVLARAKSAASTLKQELEMLKQAAAARCGRGCGY